MSSTSVIFVVASLQLLFHVETADLNFCKENVWTERSSKLRFSKELSAKEYGLGNNPKSIHCCAENFDSIKWFKNNESYPWTSGMSNFQVDTNSRNQTLFTDRITSADAGTYTCVVTSGSASIRREIPLEVFENEFSKEPRVTFTPQKRILTNVRESIRLYCETFVGKINLPDAEVVIRWCKKSDPPNITLIENNSSRVYIREVRRDDNLTFGMYLIINSIEADDFGDYECSVSNTGDQTTELVTEIARNDSPSLYIGVSIAMFAIIIMLGLFCFKYGYNFLLFVRPYVTRVKCDHNSDIKDVFILFEIREADFVTQVLIPRLTHFQYSVEAHILENGVFVGTECQTRISNCRTVLVVLSSPDPENLQECKYFAQKLYIASKLCDKVKVICPIIQEKKRINEAEIRKMVESNHNLTYFAWPLYKKDWSRLWLSLRYSLGLPLKKSAESHHNNNAIPGASAEPIPFSV